MTDIMRLAEAVASELKEYGASVELAPEFALRDVKARRIVVVPVGVERRFVSRGHRQADFKVQVGVLKKATEDELEELIAFVERIGASFLGKAVLGLRCLKSEHVPLYVPDHLKERRQFTSVVELTFAEVIAG